MNRVTSITVRPSASLMCPCVVRALVSCAMSAEVMGALRGLVVVGTASISTAGRPPRCSRHQRLPVLQGSPLGAATIPAPGLGLVPCGAGPSFFWR